MKLLLEDGMAVREVGPAGGTPVLWIHGLGESGLCFEEIVCHPLLSGRSHLIPDLPGYGRAARVRPPQDFAGIADHLAGWLAARGEPALDLVGHSLGGILALVLAERHPERVRRLVDVDGNKSPADCVFSGQALEWTPEEFLATGFHELRDAIAVSAGDDAALRGYVRSLGLADAATYRAHAEELVRLSAREDLALRLAAVDLPVSYLAGVPNGASARSLALLEEARVEVTTIEPSGHWPFINRPDAFAAALLRFIGP